MARTPEGQTKHDIKRLLDKYNVYYAMPVQNGMGKQMLDFECKVPRPKGPALPLVIEAKAPGKHMTERQEVTALDLLEIRCPVIKCDGTPDDMAKLEKLIQVLQR